MKRLENEVFNNTNMRNPKVAFLFRFVFDSHWGIVVADKDRIMKRGERFQRDVSNSKIQNFMTFVKIITENCFRTPPGM